ncbi:MAG: DNA mismatch repair protein MutS [Candidatus Helarchaeota archaeon]
MSKTPMMQQFHAIKRKYKDAILFFRVGDFYETFEDDAKIVSKELNIVLTARGKGANRVPLAGVPYHAVDSYITRLIRKGYKVAICEQIGEPPTKGIVKREVVRVITAGTLLEDSLLNAKENNYLAAFIMDKASLGIAFADISTAEFYCMQIDSEDPLSRLLMEFSRFNPRECLIPEFLMSNESLIAALQQNFDLILTSYEDFHFSYEYARNLLLEHFKVLSLEAFGCESYPLAIQASGAILSYLQETQKTPIQNIQQLKTYHLNDYMFLDAASIRNLELIRNMRDGSSTGTLLQILSHTSTAMGRRLLQHWLLHPLQNLHHINTRLNGVAELKQKAILRGDITELLTETADLERLISRVNYKRTTTKDVLGLKDTLEIVPKISALLEDTSSQILAELRNSLKGLPSIVELIDKAIIAESSERGGQIIRPGYHEELDRLRKLVKDSKHYIEKLEAQEQRRTGIKSLKVRYNKVFGYYIEVSKSNLHLVPKEYIRKQTLVNAERFITPELKDYEATVLTNQDRIIELEKQLFDQVLDKICAKTKEIQVIGNALAQLDVFVNFAELAQRNNYNRPVMTEDLSIDIKEGRHPVIEQLVINEPFIPNDVHMNCDMNRLLIITGPNMAGKSTYLRQIALICLMAQIGSFIPARSATLGIVDRIFTRIGAVDDLTRRQSTFMVEMIETGTILNQATQRSLIILDEIGRGTATFDGLSIAWAVAEYIHNRIKAKTLFATHYHELTELVNFLPGAKNFNVAVAESHGKIHFLRKVEPGAASKSYGIQVAKLAGLPSSVIERATDILKQIERQSQLQLTGAKLTREIKKIPPPKEKPIVKQKTLFEI